MLSVLLKLDNDQHKVASVGTNTSRRLGLKAYFLWGCDTAGWPVVVGCYSVASTCLFVEVI